MPLPFANSLPQITFSFAPDYWLFLWKRGSVQLLICVWDVRVRGGGNCLSLLHISDTEAILEVYFSYWSLTSLWFTSAERIKTSSILLTNC